jgi:uncharacterized protein (UPF0128 family)
MKEKWSLIKTLKKHKLKQIDLARGLGITKQAIHGHIARERNGLPLDYGFELKVREFLRSCQEVK